MKALRNNKTWCPAVPVMSQTFSIQRFCFFLNLQSICKVLFFNVKKGRTFAHFLFFSFFFFLYVYTVKQLQSPIISIWWKVFFFVTDALKLKKWSLKLQLNPVWKYRNHCSYQSFSISGKVKRILGNCIFYNKLYLQIIWETAIIYIFTIKKLFGEFSYLSSTSFKSKSASPNL